MSIWEAFGMGRHKGFSREAGLLLDEAVELAGGLGCKKADTGHLLLAMLQTDHGPAAKFLAGKNISELAVRRQLGADRENPLYLPLPNASQMLMCSLCLHFGIQQKYSPISREKISHSCRNSKKRTMQQVHRAFIH